MKWMQLSLRLLILLRLRLFENVSFKALVSIVIHFRNVALQSAAIFKKIKAFTFSFFTFVGWLIFLPTPQSFFGVVAILS